MLNDSNLWPIPCSECGQITEKNIGEWKTTRAYTCSRCRMRMDLDQDTFMRAMQDVNQSLDTIARTTRLSRKLGEFG